MPGTHSMTGLGQETAQPLLQSLETPSRPHMPHTHKASGPETADAPASRSWQPLTSAHDVLIGIGAKGNCLRAAIADCHKALQLLGCRLIAARGLEVQREAHGGVTRQESAAGGCMSPVQCLQGSGSASEGSGAMATICQKCRLASTEGSREGMQCRSLP